MRRICAVALMIVMGSLFGRVSGQSTEATADPLITEEAAQESLSTPEAILTTETPTLPPTETPSPTDLPTLIPDETFLPMPTQEAVGDPTAETTPIDIDAVSSATPERENTAWQLSARELFEDTPTAPWLVPNQWTLDANQRLAALPAIEADSFLSLPAVRYEATLDDVQAQAAFFLSEGAEASLSVRVGDNSAYTAVLDVAGHILLLRSGEIVAENTLSLLDAESHTLNVTAVGGVITVRVDEQIALTYNDPSPLPAGAVEFGGVMHPTGGLALDDLFIWLPVTTAPTPDDSTAVIPTSTAEVNIVSEIAEPESGDASAQANYQGGLTFSAPQTRTFSLNGGSVATPHTWTWTLAATTTYVVSIEKLDGNLRYSMEVVGPGGMSGNSSNEGGFYEAHWGGVGNFTLTITPHANTSGQYRVTLLPCCKPIVPLNATRSVFSTSKEWEYNLTTATPHYIWFEVTEGNFALDYQIVKRSTGAKVAGGSTDIEDFDGDGLAVLYVESTATGIYDVTFARPANTNADGSFRIGLYHGNPFPPKPQNFRTTQIGSKAISLAWDANTVNTDGYDLFRKSTGDWEYQGEFALNETAFESDAFCGSTFQFALGAFNWAGYSDFSNLENVKTQLCPPANDILWNSEVLTTFPKTFDYLPTVAPISSAENDDQDPPLSCASEGYSASLWYRYLPTTAAILNVTTANSTYDTVVGVFQNVNGKLVEKACHDDLAPFTNTTSQVIYETTTNQQYFILVAQWGTSLPSANAESHIQFSLLTRPAAPTLLTPLNKGATRDNLTWQSAPDLSYHLQIAATNTFANRLIDKYQTEKSFNTAPENAPAELPDGNYFWRVRAVTVDGITGDWSPIWSFTKDTVAPPTPTMTTPVANTVFTTLRPSFTASVPLAAGATRYEWQIATQNNFSAPVEINPDRTATTVLKLTESLSQGQYYVRVRACDAAGNCGSYTDPRPFQVDLRLLPAKDAPIVATSAASKVDFKWAPPQGVTAFQLQVSRDATFTTAHAYTRDFTVPAPPAAVPLTWSIADVGNNSVLGLGEFYWRLVFTAPSLRPAPTTPRRFVVTPPLPSAPKWIAQPNAGILNTETLKLDWLSVDYAYLGTSYDVTYQVQVDTVSTFANPKYTSPDPIEGQTHTTTALPDGIYYARVRTVNEFGAAGLWSTAQRVVIDTARPQAPVITLPYLNALSSNSRQPTKWKHVPGATHYRVQYSRTLDFNAGSMPVDVVIKAAIPPSVPSYTPPLSLAQGQYFVRVAARDAALNWSADSETVFTLTVNTAPADNGNLIPASGSTATRPLFKWATVPGATQYQVIVASEATCATEIARSPILGPTVSSWSYAKDVNGTPLAPLSYGEYYWCVAVNRGAGKPATAAFYSNTLEMPLQGFRLNVAPTVPPAVSIIYPVTNLLVPASQPSLIWTEVPATTPNGPFRYEVQVDDNALFNDLEFEIITGFDEVSIFAATLQDAKYNLRVRAINSVGGVGKWSVVRPFTIDTTDPQTPALLTPIQDSTINGLLPKITWSPVADAATYLVQISHSSNFSPRHEWRVTTTSTVVPFALLNQTYYVRVKAIDAADNRSVFTPARAFSVKWPTTQPPIPVYYTTSMPTLAWEGVTWATRYQIEVSADSGFKQIVASGFKGNLLLPEDTTFDLSPRVDGIYYWRVRAGNGTQWFAWSDVITFAVDS